MLCVRFFFQAEDGIRDIGVTGVQTCALPISVARAACDTSVRRWPVDRPQSGGLDGFRARARCGVAPTRLGGPEGDQVVGAEAAPAPSGRGHARGAGGLQKKLEQAVADARAQHPDKPIEVWATDEHRIGLKPIIRRVWAPKGQRPIALGHHRYKWLYVSAFVQPTSGETFWRDLLVRVERGVQAVLRRAPGLVCP